MTDQNLSKEDAQLAKMFEELVPTIDDDGFSNRVLARIEHRIRRRKMILASAVIAGAAIALWPVARLAVTLSDGLLVAATRWYDAAWLLQNQVAIVAVVLAAAAPFAIRWLEE